MPEGVAHRYNIFGPGLYAGALQVYTKRIISELAMEVVFKSKNLFVELPKFPDFDSHSLFHPIPFHSFHTSKTSVPVRVYGRDS